MKFDTIEQLSDIEAFNLYDNIIEQNNSNFICTYYGARNGGKVHWYVVCDDGKTTGEYNYLDGGCPNAYYCDDSFMCTLGGLHQGATYCAISYVCGGKSAGYQCCDYKP